MAALRVLASLPVIALVALAVLVPAGLSVGQTNPPAAHPPQMVAGVPTAAHHGGGEANLILPDLSNPSSFSFMGMSGHSLLMIGLVVSALGLVFGGVIYMQLKNMPVHKSMLDVSELIYET